MLDRRTPVGNKPGSSVTCVGRAFLRQSGWDNVSRRPLHTRHLVTAASPVAGFSFHFETPISSLTKVIITTKWDGGEYNLVDAALMLLSIGLMFLSKDNHLDPTRHNDCYHSFDLDNVFFLNHSSSLTDFKCMRSVLGFRRMLDLVLNHGNPNFFKLLQ